MHFPHAEIYPASNLQQLMADDSTRTGPRNSISTTGCQQPASGIRSTNSTQSSSTGTPQETGNLFSHENARHSSRMNTPMRESSANTSPSTAACHQHSSGRSTNPVQSNSNDAGGTGNFITDENAPHSSRIFIPMQESSMAEKKPMAL